MRISLNVPGTSAGVDARGSAWVRKAALLGGAALMAGLLGSSGAWAQCKDNFLVHGVIGGVNTPVANLLPLGTGSALSALTSTINTVNTSFLTTTSAFVSAPGNPQPDQQGGGAWSRVIAGTVETNTSSVGKITAESPGFLFAIGVGQQNCNTTVRQDYVGYQIGRDISILNSGGTGANWHFGATAGYLEARSKDVTPGGTFTNGPDTFITPAGSLREETQVPFVGLYTTYTKGNFFADGQVRWDFYQNRLTDALNGLSGQNLDALGVSVTGNAGYNIPLQNGWFIEPSGGIVWSNVHVDTLNVAGLGGGTFARGTVTINDIESILGRASVRVGTNITHAGVTYQPFFTASVFHEFSGDVTATTLATVGSNFAGLAVTQTSKGGVGTYGQFALGSAAVLGNSGWLGYGRVDYRVGDVIEGVSVNAGLRYQFSPEQQRASVKDGPAPSRYSYNWSGPYIGAFSGTNWGVEHAVAPAFGTKADPDFAGWISGGEIGYNFQHGHWVYGIELDYGLSNARGGVACPSAFDFACQAKVDQLASLTGRLGFTWGRALFYGKAGWAGGNVEATTLSNAGLAIAPSGTPVNGQSKWVNGWTVGGGMEFALSDKWSAKAEYMYYDLDRERFAVDGGTIINVDTQGSVVRMGVNLHFNPVQREVPLK